MPEEPAASQNYNLARMGAESKDVVAMRNRMWKMQHPNTPPPWGQEEDPEEAVNSAPKDELKPGMLKPGEKATAFDFSDLGDDDEEEEEEKK